MAEPYRKVGRGGAGNFYIATPKDVQEASNVVSDLESQTLPTSNSTASSSLSTAPSSSSTSISPAKPHLPPPEYQHTGRGGAGNWVRPSELEAKGLTQKKQSQPTLEPSSTSPSSSSSSSSSSAAAAVPRKAAKPTYRGGRGGAGNYTDFAEEERLRKEEELRMQKVTEERISRDVEMGLARPARAYGGVGGAFEMGDMK